MDPVLPPGGGETSLLRGKHPSSFSSVAGAPSSSSLLMEVSSSSLDPGERVTTAAFSTTGLRTSFGDGVFSLPLDPLPPPPPPSSSAGSSCAMLPEWLLLWLNWATLRATWLVWMISFAASPLTPLPSPPSPAKPADGPNLA